MKIFFFYYFSNHIVCIAYIDIILYVLFVELFLNIKDDIILNIFLTKFILNIPFDST